MNIPAVGEAEKSALSAKYVSKDKIAALVAILLGGAIIMFIGFSDIDVVHNAAHDTRHSFDFPCH